MPSYSLGTLTSPATPSGDQIIPLGFNPKIAFFFGNGSSSYDSFTEPVYAAMGYGKYLIGVGAFNQSSQFISQWNGLFNNQQNTSYFPASVSLYLTGGTSLSGSVFLNLKVSGKDSTSLTITWSSTTSGYSSKVDYFIIGGDDVDVAFDQASSPIVTGNQVITHGIGTTPAMLLLNFNQSNDFSTLDGTYGSLMSVGFTDGTNQGVTSISDAGSASGVRTANPTITKTYQRTNKIIAIQQPSNGAIYSEAAFSAWSSTTFTLNWTTAGAQALAYHWIVVTGVTCQVGSFNQAVAVSTQNVPTINVTPVIVMTQSFGAVASTSVQSDMRFSIGITDGANQHCQWAGSNNGISGTGNRRSVKFHTELGSVYSAAPSGVNTGSRAAIGTISLNNDSFDIDWTAVDTTARQWLFLAFGIPPQPEPPPPNSFSGLYFLDPTNRHETLVDNDATQSGYAIPNPYLETALLPTEE